MDCHDAVIQERQETTRKLNHVVRWLICVATAAAIAALLAVVFSATHLLLVAGFGAFIASLAWFVRARVNLLGKEMVRIRYTRSGLADESLPVRQRAPLLQNAEEMIG